MFLLCLFSFLSSCALFAGVSVPSVEFPLPRASLSLSSFSSPLSVVLHCTHRFSSFVRRICFLSVFYPLLSVVMFFIKLIEKNEVRFELAEKAENLMSTRENCEHWLGNLTSWQNIYKIADKIDEFSVSAKGYPYSVQEKQKPEEQTKSHHSKSSFSLTLSSTTSQRKHNLVLATMKKRLYWNRTNLSYV